MTLHWVRGFTKGLHVWQVDSISVHHNQTTRMLLLRLVRVWNPGKTRTRKSYKTSKTQTASQTQKETTLFYHNTHNGSIPL